ncbi:MAG: hypothetical protein JXR52_08990 [Bacteroidales bacterium]|nr:hypothetical protein [Bacteroidales bacterium]MBN2698949.1 hypothetical protein [Bacteroidales bacterium]
MITNHLWKKNRNSIRAAWMQGFILPRGEIGYGEWGDSRHYFRRIGEIR